MVCGEIKFEDFGLFRKCGEEPRWSEINSLTHAAPRAPSPEASVALSPTPPRDTNYFFCGAFGRRRYAALVKLVSGVSLSVGLSITIFSVAGLLLSSLGLCRPLLLCF